MTEELRGSAAVSMGMCQSRSPCLSLPSGWDDRRAPPPPPLQLTRGAAAPLSTRLCGPAGSLAARWEFQWDVPVLDPRYLVLSPKGRGAGRVRDSGRGPGGGPRRAGRGPAHPEVGAPRSPQRSGAWCPRTTQHSAAEARPRLPDSCDPEPLSGRAWRPRSGPPQGRAHPRAPEPRRAWAHRGGPGLKPACPGTPPPAAGHSPGPGRTDGEGQGAGPRGRRGTASAGPSVLTGESFKSRKGHLPLLQFNRCTKREHAGAHGDGAGPTPLTGATSRPRPSVRAGDDRGPRSRPRGTQHSSRRRRLCLKGDSSRARTRWGAAVTSVRFQNVSSP
ncbi:PREDICTED: proline-rich protein 2-like [Chinchilla lanigera]|uniref:proline-rich protein 2-like n=1 Tax=Chinchilla lanigera TaxID=34839 RepID=UPI000696F9DF|nr:PREDICTED: proline-rich protein 2-like [Chinchilla lanigera]